MWVEKLLQIKTERIYLRKIDMHDLTDYFRMYSDKESMQYRGQNPFKTIDEAKKAMHEIEVDFLKEKKFRIVIASLNDDKMIGMFILKDISKTGCAIGYSLDKNYWSRGIITEVCNAIIHYLFTQTEIKIIHATVNEQNLASVKVLNKLQFNFIAKDTKNLLHYKKIKKPH